MFEQFRLLQGKNALRMFSLLIQVIWRAKIMNQCQSLLSIRKGCWGAWRCTSKIGVVRFFAVNAPKAAAARVNVVAHNLKRAHIKRCSLAAVAPTGHAKKIAVQCFHHLGRNGSIDFVCIADRGDKNTKLVRKPFGCFFQWKIMAVLCRDHFLQIVRAVASAGLSDGATVPSTSWLPASVCRNTKISGVTFEHRDIIGKTFYT